MTRRVFRTLLAPLAAVVAAMAVSAPAGAHVAPAAGGLGDGLAHPVLGLDHLLAMVAVGVVAAVAFEGQRRWLVPAAFVGAMAVGGLAGLASISAPGMELVVVASVLLGGIAIAAAVQLRASSGPVVLALLGVAGFAHGHAHGVEAPDAVSPLLYVAGLVAATICLHLAGVVLGSIVRDRDAARVGVGAFTAAAGALLLLG